MDVTKYPSSVDPDLLRYSIPEQPVLINRPRPSLKIVVRVSLLIQCSDEVHKPNMKDWGCHIFPVRNNGGVSIENVDC